MNNNHSYFGNQELLNMRKVGFLAASKISTLSVLPTFDWAIEISKHEDIVVVSGFSSHLEKKVLDFLLKGKCKILLVLARKPFKRIPAELNPFLESGRLTIFSTTNLTRQSKSSALARNKYIAEMCDEIVIPSINHESSLYQIYIEYINKIRLIHDDNNFV